MRQSQPPRPYKEVHCLMLSWAQSDFDADYVVLQLATTFRDQIKVDSLSWYDIPTCQSYEKLEEKVFDFTSRYSSPDVLLILFYSGHARLDSQGRLTWLPWDDDKTTAPILDWFRLQSKLASTVSDILYLFDCCAASGAGVLGVSKFSSGGKKELLAACASDGSAPLNGPGVFTTLLTEALQSCVSKGGIFSILGVHQHMVTQSTRLQVQEKFYASTPIFVRLNGPCWEPPTLLGSEPCEIQAWSSQGRAKLRFALPALDQGRDCSRTLVCLA